MNSARVPANADAPIITTDLTALAAQINAGHAAALGHAHSAVQHARRTGELLLRAKEHVGHGAWLDWLWANCELSESSARAYMRVARHCFTSAEAGAQMDSLTLRDALAALTTPKSAAADDLQERSRVPLSSGAVTMGEVGGQPRFILFESARHPGYWHDLDIADGTVSTRPMRPAGFSLFGRFRNLANIAWSTASDDGTWLALLDPVTS